MPGKKRQREDVEASKRIKFTDDLPMSTSPDEIDFPRKRRDIGGEKTKIENIRVEHLNYKVST